MFVDPLGAGYGRRNENRANGALDGSPRWSGAEPSGLKRGEHKAEAYRSEPAPRQTEVAENAEEIALWPVKLREMARKRIADYLAYECAGVPGCSGAPSKANA